MLKGISPLISPELLAVMHRMGHGESLLLCDAHFPAHDCAGVPVLRADGLAIAPLLEAIAPLFILDDYADEPLAMMEAVPGDTLDPQVEADYLSALKRGGATRLQVKQIERFAFYQAAKQAHAILVTGELRKYGNILLRKGVTPVQASS